MDIALKRAYEPAAESDGYRLLVDRLWPRGVSRARARLDEWDRNLAPSNELRTWFGHDPARFDEFRRRYMVELEGQTERLRDLRRIAGQGRLTLVYAARDPEHNDAVVLADVLRRVETSFAGIGNTSDTMTPRPTVRALGVNHVALEVDSVDAALAWWGRFLSFELRGRRPTMAWIDLGDQFIALSEPRSQAADDSRHFGLVVDDKEALRAALRAADVDVPFHGSLRFRDPWGNNIEVVDYRDVQFTKSRTVLDAMGLGGLRKSADALDELRKKGLT